ncbi:Hypp6404 [Branchiostoma lanceolatum]|uniref:Hypp6404 protein n=1 Tax=Branchiostoma lanceolatum TaxID=7740 RepID=A0A8J9YU23_BRALA|nr:Hypp6404 [Branchiostoma lanceolatum]
MDRKKGTPFTLSEDKTTVTFEYSFNRWDFNRSGRIPIWTVSNQAAWLLHMGLSALDSDLSELRAFTRCHVWELSPSFYSLVKPGTRLKVSSRMLHVGKTSMIKGGEMVDSSTNQILVKGITQDVHISMDTRRPQPFPDWMKEMFLHLTSEPRPETVEEFEEPQNTTKTFVYSVTVPPSDIDMNNHTNQSQYIRYCFNCAAVGAKQGAYPTVRGDLFKQGVRKVSVLYQKESLEGDVLTVESWEESPGTLRFQVRKGSEKVVQVTMQFYVTSGSETKNSKL